MQTIGKGDLKGGLKGARRNGFAPRFALRFALPMETFVVALLVCAFVLGGGGPVGAQQITVAVMPFEYEGSRDLAGMSAGIQLTNMITDKLVNVGDYDVVERDRISGVIDEQDFGQSGRVDPAHAVEIGRLLGAQVLIFGTVTRFETTSGAGVSFGSFSLSGTRAQAALSGRIVDATTGVVLGSVEGTGDATGASLSVRDFEGVSFDASEFQNSALGRAVRDAVSNFTDEMAKVIDDNKDRVFEAEARASARGVVLAFIDNGIVVNIGSDAGIRVGQKLDVFRLMEIEGVADPVRIPVGVVEVISVDPGAAVAVFESITSQQIEIGDVVSPR